MEILLQKRGIVEFKAYIKDGNVTITMECKHQFYGLSMRINKTLVKNLALLAETVTDELKNKGGEVEHG